ncbi:hypothetical protein NITLEN_60031 [Nitrospira lenta]|uniref:Uncharacterized protein n=1 Tax=Nitrospira lenta TaxID=1436998 RepID=A0A330LAC6_9BACT|nr:hypothetical protein NITLEN_60031 [Nitrospira lenta]
MTECSGRVRTKAVRNCGVEPGSKALHTDMVTEGQSTVLMIAAVSLALVRGLVKRCVGASSMAARPFATWRTFFLP